MIGALLVAACDDAPADPPARVPDVVLVVDGDLVIRDTEIAAFDAYFDALDASMGIKYRTRELLDQHLLPLALARRAFPTERAAALRLATDLRAVADNSIELTHKGAIAGGAATPGTLGRNSFPLPVAAWAFDPAHIGAVSPPIETARGYVLIAPLDLTPGLTSADDRLSAFIVEFPAPPQLDFDTWLSRARVAIADRVEYVAPRLDGALPRWLRP